MIGNRVIWKFRLSHHGQTVLSIPALSSIKLSGVDPQTRQPALWIELDPEAERVNRTFKILATGQPIEGDGGYPYDIHVGTVIDGNFVWHIYEKRL